MYVNIVHTHTNEWNIIVGNGVMECTLVHVVMVPTFYKIYKRT